MKTTSIVSILTTFLLLWHATEAKGTDFCVSTPAELQTALTTAQANDQADVIKIVQGTYSGRFSYDSSNGKSIGLGGGYTTSCATRVVDPSNTILDAGGTGTPLLIGQHGGGSVDIEGVTFQHGGYQGLWVRSRNTSGGQVGAISIRKNIIKDNAGRVGVYIGSENDSAFVPGAIHLWDNVIAGNRGDYGAGGLAMQVMWSTTANYVGLANNIIVGNTGSDWGGGGFINIYPSTTLYLTNNTISENRAFGPHSAAGGFYISNLNKQNTILYLYNNIIRENFCESGVMDVAFYDYGSRVGYNNNYSELSGNWTESGNNINTNSRFVNPGYWNDNGTPTDKSDDFWVGGDYHLSSTSLCIDAGNNFAPYLQSSDFEGDSRIFDGNYDGTPTVDIGADEYDGPRPPSQGMFFVIPNKKTNRPATIYLE